MTVAEALESARTFLFVPGNRPDRFDKALDAGADVVVFDLEDAVPPGEKVSARQHIIDVLRRVHVPVVVRINGVETIWHDDDVRAAVVGGAHIMLPKAEAPWTIDAMGIPSDSGVRVVALIETPTGVLNAVQIARSPLVARLAFGSLDLAAALGVDPDHREALVAARAHLVLASAADELPGPIDGVTQAVRDEDALDADLCHAKMLGFTGKLCIHPAQLPQTRQSFAPTADELRWSARVLDAVTSQAGADGGVTVLDGKMIDAPVIKRAQLIQAAGVFT
ncbi:HpcH/HpaI aldolase/citrate lyase family protein [Microbacterium sp. A93]|uniref:HpcH/HpaI aldolase/citrate lyase family protein n=1 Tax=Microbacterium sp. A93 TaxID=3450716 RepID=UPI003F439D4B